MEQQDLEEIQTEEEVMANLETPEQSGTEEEEVEQQQPSPLIQTTPTSGNKKPQSLEGAPRK